MPRHQRRSTLVATEVAPSLTILQDILDIRRGRISLPFIRLLQLSMESTRLLPTARFLQRVPSLPFPVPLCP